MADKHKFRFIEKPKAKGSKTAIGLAIASALLMIGAFLISFIFQGAGSTTLGAMGLCAFGLSVYGFILGLLGLNQRKVDHRPAFVGALLCGFLAIMWLAVFFVGLK